MRRLITGGSLLGMVAAAAMAGAGAMGGYRSDTHAPTSCDSQEADKRRAEEKRRRREEKRAQLIKRQSNL